MMAGKVVEASLQPIASAIGCRLGSAMLETASDALFRDEQEWRAEWGAYPEPLRQAHALIAREIARRKGR
jgi:hypothetical protein